ncbi:hypothetical protein F4804DRAFT_96548 [Jackrogersella minutella]|nr:hypothetical protein F4804DRAFT_96548 [Jackrogersella minutella]
MRFAHSILLAIGFPQLCRSTCQSSSQRQSPGHFRHRAILFRILYSVNGSVDDTFCSRRPELNWFPTSMQRSCIYYVGKNMLSIENIAASRASRQLAIAYI